MVDADTKVDKRALRILVNALQADSMIMGLCGETRISNKRESWVTMIQVFEYYISHHLGKAFESVFGGVTCLPGCFCMYRIKVLAIGFADLIGTKEWGLGSSLGEPRSCDKICGKQNRHPSQEEPAASRGRQISIHPAFKVLSKAKADVRPRCIVSHRGPIKIFHSSFTAAKMDKLHHS